MDAIKNFATGANSASNNTEFSEGIHESAVPSKTGTSAGTSVDTRSNLNVDGPSMLSKDGAIGKHFTPEGSIGGTADKAGGPLSKDGAIGKQFTTGGAIGGTGQKAAEQSEMMQNR